MLIRINWSVRARQMIAEARNRRITAINISFLDNDAVSVLFAFSCGNLRLLLHPVSYLLIGMRTDRAARCQKTRKQWNWSERRREGVKDRARGEKKNGNGDRRRFGWKERRSGERKEGGEEGREGEGEREDPDDRSSIADRRTVWFCRLGKETRKER